jgi:hypothetical protein
LHSRSSPRQDHPAPMRAFLGRLRGEVRHCEMVRSRRWRKRTPSGRAVNMKPGRRAHPHHLSDDGGYWCGSACLNPPKAGVGRVHFPVGQGGLPFHSTAPDVIADRTPGMGTPPPRASMLLRSGSAPGAEEVSAAPAAGTMAASPMGASSPILGVVACRRNSGGGGA